MGAKTKAKVPTAAAVYCRISMDRSGEGLGVERQEELCRTLAKERGWPVAEVYCDNDRSAHNGKPRPAYERMLADIGAGLRDAVVCVDLDRLTRRSIELERFMNLADAHGVALANVSGDIDLASSDGRFKARIMGAVASQESEKKSERVAREAEQAARRGVPRGSRRPFGYESDRVTIREEEAALIREAAQRVLDGATVPSIAREWNSRSVSTPQGAAHGWSSTSVAELLRSPRLIGARTYHGEIVAEGAWEPILDRDVFERLQARIRRSSRPGRAPKRMLSGLAHCGRCGAPMWTSSHKRGDYSVPRDSCILGPGRPGCGGVAIVADPCDELITEAVLHRLDSQAMTRALARKPKKAKKPDIDLAAIEQDLEDLARDFGAGDISRREWLAAKKPLEERRALALRQVDTANGTAVLEPFRSGDVRKTWETLDVDRRRVVLNALIDRVVVGRATKPGKFTADRVDVEWRV
jgi:DNA invertase Pin-like site-specific DNA recombinase